MGEREEIYDLCRYRNLLTESVRRVSGVTDPLAATLVGGDGGNGLEPIVSTIGQMTLLLRHH